MMNSNPDDNDSPNDDDNTNKPIFFNESLDRKITASVSRPKGKDKGIGPNDVLCGRSKSSFNHAGNRRFRSIVTGSLDEYTEATSKWAKSMVAAKLVGVIHASGGRFLKQKKDNDDEWYELSTQEAKAKVSHAIRDAIAAKDKTKASRAGTPTSAPQKKVQDPPPTQLHKLRGGMQPRSSSLSAIGSSSSSHEMMAATQQQQVMRSQSLTLTSMAQPIFSMGGPQVFGGGIGGTTNLVHSQMQQFQQQQQHLPLHQQQQQHQMQQHLQQPQFQGNMNLAIGPNLLGGLGGGRASTGALPALSSMSQSQQQHQLQLQQQVTGLPPLLGVQPQHHSDNLAHGSLHGLEPPGFQRAALPSASIASLPTQQQLGSILGRSGDAVPLSAVARAPARRRPGEETKRSSSSDTEDGDTEFLSLIDTVLGPVHSPKGNRGKKR